MQQSSLQPRVRYDMNNSHMTQKICWCIFLLTAAVLLPGGLSAQEQQPTRPEPPIEPPYYIYNAIEKVGFIRKPPVSPSGVIFKTKEDREIISYGDTVYIRLEAADTMPTDSLFTVYRTLETVKDPEDKKNTLGTQHYLVGVVKVTRQEEGYVLATVVRSYRTIEINDRVMPYETVSPKIYLDDNPAPVSGTILKSEEGTNLIGENAIAFINKGEQDGVALGQQYHVYNQEKVKLKEGKKQAQQLPPANIGSIIVLRAEQNTATVLVVDSAIEFASGAKFSAILE